MNTSNDLFQLIASMSKQEKRYFKLNASVYNKEEGNSYLRLYDVIDKGKVANDTELAVAVKNEPFARYLSIVKKQLTELLLNSLTAYHTDKKTNFELRQMLSHVEILFDKRLYNHCHKILTRAEKRAEQVNRHLFKMEISYWKRLLLLKNISHTFESDIHALYDEANSTLQTLADTNHYLELMDITQAIAIRYASHPHAEALQKLHDIVNNPLLRTAASARSFDAKLAFHHIHGAYLLMVGNYADALTHYKDAVQLWEEYPEMIKERPTQYRRYLINYLNCLISSSHEDKEFTSVIANIKAIPPPPTDTPLNHMKEVWNLELFHYLNSGQLDKGTSVIEEISKALKLQRTNAQPSALLSLCYNCSVFYFLLGKHASSLEYINTIINETRIELKQDIQAFTRVLGLIIHYELHNVDILDNMMRSTQRFLKQTNNQSPFEQHVLRAMKSLLCCVDHRETLPVFRMLHHNLVAILHASHAEPLGLLEVLFWTDSKIQERPIREVFTEKMQSTSSTNHRAIFPLPSDSTL